MKYIILMYTAEGTWPPDEHKVALAESVELCHRLHDEGKYISAGVQAQLVDAFASQAIGQTPMFFGALKKERLGNGI